jgi:hypothetical protein
MMPIQIVVFIVPTGSPSPALLAFWGLTWTLLGYGIYSASRASETRATET